MPLKRRWIACENATPKFQMLLITDISACDHRLTVVLLVQYRAACLVAYHCNEWSTFMHPELLYDTSTTQGTPLLQLVSLLYYSFRFPAGDVRAPQLTVSASTGVICPAHDISRQNGFSIMCIDRFNINQAYFMW